MIAVRTTPLILYWNRASSGNLGWAIALHFWIHNSAQVGSYKIDKVEVNLSSGQFEVLTEFENQEGILVFSAGFCTVISASHSPHAIW